MKTLGKMTVDLSLTIRKKRRGYKKVIVYFCLMITCVLCISENAYAQVKAYVTQSSYYQGDPITLVIETDQSVADQPDLTPLENDFELRGSSSSSSIKFINGKRSYSKTWRIQLQAKQTGNLKVPVISLGAEQTKEIALSVKILPPELAAETDKHIFIESALDNGQQEIYVQQQVPYTVKFFYDAAMQTGEIILPIIENANLRVLGKEKKYQTTREGRNFVVVERRYVVSPEKSGELIIPPTIVEGRIAITQGDSEQLRKRMDETDMLNELFFDLNSGSRFNPFDPFFSRRSIGPTRPYRVGSEAIKLNILPVPSEFTGNAWLPTEEIKMQDSWATNPPQLKVGEPVSRTIVMQVKGLANSQIPEIKIPEPKGMKVYPEAAKGQSPNDGNTIYGLQQTDVSYIPSQAGDVIIPEIKVDWWDVKTKQQRTYVLPKWHLTVDKGVATAINSQGEGNENIISNANEQTKMDSREASINEKTEDNSINIGVRDNQAKNNKQLLKNIVLIVLLIGVLTYCLNLFRRRYQQSSKYLSQQHRQVTIENANKLKVKLLKACQTNDKELAARFLIDYASKIYGENKFTSLGDLSDALVTGDDVVNTLIVSLYGVSEKAWNGDELASLINHGLLFQSEKIHTEVTGLLPLYPH